MKKFIKGVLILGVAGFAGIVMLVVFGVLAPMASRDGAIKAQQQVEDTRTFREVIEQDKEGNGLADWQFNSIMEMNYAYKDVTKGDLFRLMPSEKKEGNVTKITYTFKQSTLNKISPSLLAEVKQLKVIITDEWQLIFKEHFPERTVKVYFNEA